MIDQANGSKKAKNTEVVGVSADDHSAPRALTNRDLSAVEEALVLAYPTPEDDEAFREYLRKNGSGGGDP